MERDARVTLINLIISNPTMFSNLTSQQAQDIFDYVISLAEKNVSYNPEDSMMEMQLAQVLDTAARYNYRNIEKFNFYSSQAINAIDASIAASPGRATTYFVKAQMQLVRMENDEAIATMKTGIALNPNYYEGHCRLAQIYFVINDAKYDKDKGEALNNCVDKGGSQQITSATLLKMAINYYSDNKDFARAAILSERLATISQADPEVWYNLAKIYMVIGNTAKADESFQKAKILDPKLTDADWQTFKSTVEANRKIQK